VGAVKADTTDFPVNKLFDRLRDELTYHAQAAGLALRVIPCALSIQSDPRLLEQMVRNLLSNALKYTQRGKVLVGCRRRKGKLRIESGDTGVASPHRSYRRYSKNTANWTIRPPAKPRSGTGAVHRQEPGPTSCHRIRVRSLKERARCSRSRSRYRRAGGRRGLHMSRAALTTLRRTLRTLRNDP